MAETPEGLNALQTAVAASWWLLPLFILVYRVLVRGDRPPGDRR